MCMISKKAFSLIELLIVIVIIGILFTIAIPSYNNYVIKAKILNIFSLLDGHKIKVVEKIFNADPSVVEDNYSLHNPTKFVADLEHIVNHSNKEYRIKATANMASLGVKLINGVPLIIELTANFDDVSDVIDWSCTCTKGYGELVPKSCKEKD